MTTLSLNRDGFITHWLIAGPKTEDFHVEASFSDQLAYEKHMRSLIRDDAPWAPPANIAPGEPTALGMPWRYCGGGNGYVDVSVFYSLPVKVELYACTQLEAAEECALEAELWTYAAIDLFVNGERVCAVQNPVYKPITRRSVALKLKKGVNHIFVRMQNLGVRDTRSIFGLQLKQAADRVHVSLPGGAPAMELAALDEWLRGVTQQEGALTLPGPCPGMLTLAPLGLSPAPDATRVELPLGTASIRLEAQLAGTVLTRDLERIEQVHPRYADTQRSAEERRMDIFRRIATRDKPGDKFTIFNILARYCTGTNTPADRPLILENLARIDARIDCSDFIAIGLIRLMRLYKLDDALMESIKQTFLHYRYWMDEQGADGMCFWSENHSLLFHGAQYIAGGLYPEDVFVRSGRTGREQQRIGERRCREWLASVETEGFEEFISSGYMCVTFAALLNLVDFACEDLAQGARRVADKLLEQLCRHTFRGTVFGPQGRVYRDVIHPFRQGTQALIHYLDPDAPYADDNWLACLAGTSYHAPESLDGLMHTPLSVRYANGNGEIALCKRGGYILTSVASPCEGAAPAWRNIAFDPDAEKDSFLYTKSLNERFHGTTLFAPGVFGYQQHFWYAALDNECLVFTNHPGGMVDASTMRPGYWYGNGIFPAVKQKDNLLGAVYAIPESYPIHFTHLYFPAAKFDEYVLEDGWLFARKGDAWLGVWCSAPLEWHDDMLTRCELRCRGDRMAYVCLCADKEEDASFEAFKARCRALGVCFDPVRLRLSAGPDFSLRYAAYTDDTQYI